MAVARCLLPVTAKGWFPVLLALAFTVSGCGPRRPLTLVERGDREGVLHLGSGAEPEDLDPHTAGGDKEGAILRALGEGLVSLDGRDLHPVPGVAERWEISADGLVYTFHLRENARWSDGRPLGAADFLASFRRLLTPRLASGNAPWLYGVRRAEAYHRGEETDFARVGVEAPDARTLRLTLERPTPHLLTLLAGRGGFPVPLAVIERFGPADRRDGRWVRPENFVGNGPFVLSEWRVNQEIVCRPNPHYWNAKALRLREIHFHVSDDLDAEERAFRGGLLHKTFSVPQSKLDVLRSETPSRLRLDPVLAVYYFLLNTTRPPLDDVRVRRALALAVDRAALVRSVTRGGQPPAFSFVPPAAGGAGSAGRGALTTDPEAGRRLLAEAGYPGGRGLPELEILFNTSDNHRRIAEAVQEMWRRELGIEARLTNQEWKVFVNSRRTMNYQIARGGWAGAYPDPNAFLEIFRAGAPNNGTGFADAEFDRLLTEAAGAVDLTTRTERFREAEARLLETVPVIPMYFQTSAYLLAPSVRGWEPNALDYHPFQNVWLEP